MSNPASSSGLLSASAAVLAMPGTLKGLMVHADGTNAATVIIYDSASAASGRVLAKVSVKATDRFEELVLADCGIVANNGIYAAVSGTGAECIVLFIPG